MQRVQVFYTDGTQEVLEGTIVMGNGYIKVERPRESDPDAIIATIDVTDSEYIPFSSLKKLKTIP